MFVSTPRSLSSASQYWSDCRASGDGYAAPSTTCSQDWEQCGGAGGGAVDGVWGGPTCCLAGSSCTYVDEVNVNVVSTPRRGAAALPSGDWNRSVYPVFFIFHTIYCCLALTKNTLPSTRGRNIPSPRGGCSATTPPTYPALCGMRFLMSFSLKLSVVVRLPPRRVRRTAVSEGIKTVGAQSDEDGLRHQLGALRPS